jgi:hypothetical protein
LVETNYDCQKELVLTKVQFIPAENVKGGNMYSIKKLAFVALLCSCVFFPSVVRAKPADSLNSAVSVKPVNSLNSKARQRVLEKYKIFSCHCYLNQDIVLPNNNSSAIVSITVVLPGIDPSEIGGPFVNPFGDQNPSITTDANGNTLITFSGSPIAAGTPTHFGFGLNGATPTSGQLMENPGLNQVTVGLMQTGGQVEEVALPTVDRSVKTPASQEVQYVVGYVETQDPTAQNGISLRDWFQFPIAANAPFTINFNNPSGSASVSLSNVRYLVSNMRIPLAALNSTSLPPNAPEFIPLSSTIPDQTVLSPGEKIDVEVNR